MRRVAFTLATLAALLSRPPMSSGEPPPGGAPKRELPVDKTEVQQLMQRKRELSHEAFDAIVAKDFPRIGRNAKALAAISQAVEWRVIPTPHYLQYSVEFQEVAEKLAEKARDKNSDGVTLAFTQMTFSCVRCHDYIRQTRSTRLDPGSDRPVPGAARAAGPQGRAGEGGL
jgi:hypothetical protein